MTEPKIITRQRHAKSVRAHKGSAQVIKTCLLRFSLLQCD